MRVRLRDGTRLFVDVEGLGLVPDGPTMRTRPTLVLLHGGEIDHSWFKPRFSTLADVAQLVYVDHRGFGRSERASPESWTLERWADDVHELCDVLGLDHPFVLGSSLGGTIALGYASRHPEQPGGLIVASATARRNVAQQLDAYERLGGEGARRTATSFLVDRDPTAQQEWIERCAPLNAKYSWSADELARIEECAAVMAHWVDGESRTFDLRAGLGNIRCPTLLIAGSDDPLAPPEAMIEVAQSLREGVGRLEVVEGAGHGVCRDAPEVFFSLVRDFLRTNGP